MSEANRLSILERTALQRLEEFERRLAAMQGELEHTHRLATVGTVTAGIAHEINNLLTPALGYARLAAKRPDDPELQAKANVQAIECIEAASRILGAILDFSAARDPSLVAGVYESVDSALRCIGRDLARDRISLNIDVKADLCVRIAPVGLQQVFVNLLLNAIRVLRGRDGHIRVTAHRPIRGNTTIIFSDDGPGIPAGVRSTLFDPFVTAPPVSEQGRRSDEPPLGGSGLGLAVCRRVLEASGGGISAQETPGGGATFVIEIPTAAARIRSDAA